MEGRDDCLFCLYLLRVYNASWIEVFLSQLIYNIYFDGQNKIVTVMGTVIFTSKVQLLFKLHLSYGVTIQSKYSVLRLCDTLNKLIVLSFCLLPISFLLVIFFINPTFTYFQQLLEIPYIAEVYSIPCGTFATKLL